MKYSESLMIRLTPELKTAIEQRAARQAIAPSTLVRSMLFRAFFGDTNLERIKTRKDMADAYLPELP